MRRAAFALAAALGSLSSPALAQNQYDTRPTGAPPAGQPGMPAGQPGMPGAGAPQGYPPAGQQQYQTTTSSTARALDQSEQEDSGRGFELFYGHLDAGFSYQNLAAFSGAGELGLDTQDAVGAAFGAGAGVRLFLFTLGLRGRLHTLSSFNLWQANAVLGLHIPISSLDLYGELFGGYSVANSFGSGTIPAAVRDPADRAGVAALGGNVGLGFGADYYFNQYVSLGGGVTGETLLLSRGKLTAPEGSSEAVRQNALFADSAALAGVGLVASLRLGFHLGL